MRLMIFIAWKVYQKARSGKLPQCYTFQQVAGRIPPSRSACAQNRGNRTRILCASNCRRRSLKQAH